MKRLYNILFICVLMSLFSSCSCSWYAKRATAKCGLTTTDSIVKTDSIFESVKEKIVLKDTTIYITREGVIQYLPNLCALLCDSLGNLKPFKSESKKNGVKSTITSIGNVLAIECKTDSLEAVIQLQNKTIERITKEKHTLDKTHSEQVAVHIRTWYEQSCIYGFWVLLVAVGGYVFLRVKKLVS